MKYSQNVQCNQVLSVVEMTQFVAPLGLDTTGVMAIAYMDGEKLLHKVKTRYDNEQIDEETFRKLVSILENNYTV